MIYAHLELYLRRHLKSASGAYNYMRDIENFIAVNPGYQMYGYVEVSKYFAWLNDRYRREDGRATGSVSRIFAAVKLLYSFLVHSGLRDTHPFPLSYRIKGMRKKGLDEGKVLTPSELNHLLILFRNAENRLTALPARNLAAVSLLVHQAPTSAEIFALKVSDIDLDQGTIKIPATVSTDARVLPLHPSQFMVLHSYLTGARRRLLGDYSATETVSKRFLLGLGGTGQSRQLFAPIFKPYKLLFGNKPVTAENIRMSVIYNRLNVDKLPLETVQAFAGHKWPSSTEKYVSRIDVEDRDFINGIHPMELL